MSFRKNRNNRRIRFVATSLFLIFFPTLWSACGEKATRPYRSVIFVTF